MARVWATTPNPHLQPPPLYTPSLFLISWHKFPSGAGYRVYCVNDCRTARLNFEPTEGRAARSPCWLWGEQRRLYRERNRLGVNPFMIGIVKIPEKMVRQKKGEADTFQQQQ